MVILWVLLPASLVPAAPAPANAAGGSGPAASARFTPIVVAAQKTLPCVVNIGTEQVVQVYDPFDTFFNEFFGGRGKLHKESIPLGSGVIVDPSGLIITNNHVVRRASRIDIRLYNGKTFQAVLVAADSVNDLALLRLKNLPEGETLHAISFGVPDDLMLGEAVVSVGNPFGLEHSVSAGVLSAKNRSFQEEDRTFNDILQTDAAINPGNSGGPLVNADAQMIGINLAIRRGAEGIGFAIPMRRIESVLAHWLLPTRFSQSTCGFVPATKVAGGKCECTVTEVDPEGPAARAGLKDGDHILSANGARVTRALDLGQLLWRLGPGDTLKLALEDGRNVALKIVALEPADLVRQKLGITVQELNKPLLKALGLPENVRGLAISEVLPDCPLTEYGVRRGDVILGVGQTETTSVEILVNCLKKTASGDIVKLFVLATQTVRGQVLLRQVPLEVVIR